MLQTRIMFRPAVIFCLVQALTALPTDPALYRKPEPAVVLSDEGSGFPEPNVIVRSNSTSDCYGGTKTVANIVTSTSDYKFTLNVNVTPINKCNTTREGLSQPALLDQPMKPRNDSNVPQHIGSTEPQTNVFQLPRFDVKSKCDQTTPNEDQSKNQPLSEVLPTFGPYQDEATCENHETEECCDQSETKDRSQSDHSQTKVESPSGKSETKDDSPSDQSETKVESPSGKSEAKDDSPSDQSETQVESPSGKSEAKDDSPSGKSEAKGDSPSDQSEAKDDSPSDQSETNVGSPSDSSTDNTELLPGETTSNATLPITSLNSTTPNEQSLNTNSSAPISDDNQADNKTPDETSAEQTSTSKSPSEDKEDDPASSNPSKPEEKSEESTKTEKTSPDEKS